MKGTIVDTPPTYTTYGAIMHDKNDPDNGRSYYYASFLLDEYDVASKVKNRMQVLKIDSVTYNIEWNYEYYD